MDMKNFLTVVGLGISGIALVFVLAVFSGTILYWIWPVAIPSVFPGLVASGIIAGKLSWWVAVTFTWICGIFIKSSQTNTTKKG
jgi:hypothetical protein